MRIFSPAIANPWCCPWWACTTAWPRQNDVPWQHRWGGIYVPSIGWLPYERSWCQGGWGSITMDPMCSTNVHPWCMSTMGCNFGPQLLRRSIAVPGGSVAVWPYRGKGQARNMAHEGGFLSLGDWAHCWTGKPWRFLSFLLLVLLLLLRLMFPRPGRGC